MRIIYHSLLTTSIAIVSVLSALPLHAQLSGRERKEIRERAERAREAAHRAGPQMQLPVTKETMTLPAPVIVDFTERANWDLAHPKTDFTPHNMEDHDGDKDFKFQPQPMGPGAVISNISTQRNSGTNNDGMKAGVASPAPILAFNGVMGDGSEIPPDIKMAAGTNYVMETTNQQFGIYNKITGALVSNVQITTFFNASGGNGYFDPHILYDGPHGRWLIVIDGNTSGGNGGLFLAISKTSDPTGAWYVYTVDDGINANTLLDFPEMGYNQNWVVLTANLFSNSTITEVYIMNRASLYSGTQGTITHFTDANSFCVSPVQTFDTTTLTEYLVQNSNGANAQVRVGTITGAVNSPTYSAGTQMAASVNSVLQKWNENSVQAAQQGSSALIDNDDTRIYQSQYINGSMWFSHTVWLPATGTPTYSGVDWWQLNPATLTLQQFGRVTNGTSGTWYYYPNIYANAQGDAILGYCVSSSSLYASAVYSFHAAADAANSMESLYTFKSGVASFAPSGFGGDYRWGDYTGAAVDPVDNSFWVAGQWANTGNKWATEIAHVGATAINSPPVAAFQANVTTSCTGAISFSDLSSNSPTSWLWTFGDGATSTLQNPTHTYLTNGVFTVTLKATNAYGNNTQTSTNYITVSEPAGPSATGASHCGNSTFSLSANTSNPVSWYDAGGTLLSSSNPFVTPTLTQTTTYYVSEVVPTTDSAGPVNNTSAGSGGYLSAAWSLNFNVLKAGTLASVYIYAQIAGSITINLDNSSGTTVNTKTVTVPAGGSRVTLNFPLTVGSGYAINYSSTTTNFALYRNNAGAAFPYTDANGVVSITGNDAGSTATGYYYWFYNWYITAPGCSSQTTAVTATVTSGLNTSNPNITNVACYGAATGSASIITSGGTPNYTYTWSNGQTGTTLSNVAAGTYHVTISDAGGCSTTASATISQPAAALNVSATAVNSGCGAPNGSVTATVSGGTTSYNYLWSNAATSASITDLSAATYHVTVTDNHSCTATASATVSSSGALNISATPSSTNCSGGSTGGATTSISGGTSPFTYSWSNGATSSAISGVAPGTYHVTVSDQTGCSGTSSVVVAIGTAPTVTASLTNVNCFNGNGGSASLSVSGGTSPYSYAWNNGATSSSIANVTAGNYYVTVTDAHSCIRIDTVMVTQPASITIFVNAVQPTCFGLTNGSATVSATGGTPSYVFSWSTNVTGTGISNLAQGSYSVTLTDANNCTSLSTFNITNPVAVSGSVVTDNESCFGAGDGSVQVTPAGGTGPYNYLWSNNSTAETINNLTAQSYTVTITDVHNCSATTSATITEPSQITVSVSSTDDINGQSSGTATVNNVTGGNPPYVATWSNGQSGNTISGLAAGTYTVTVTDHNGCETTATDVVNNTVGIAGLSNDLSFTIYPNPAKTEVTIDAGDLNKETTLVLEDVLGQSLITKSITSSPVSLDLEGYANGVYFIELRQGGKRSIRKFVINR